MDIIIAFALSIIVSVALKNQIKSYPFLFYAIAAIAVAAFASISFSDGIPAFIRSAYPYIQRCLLAFGFFAVVMLIGVLPESSKTRKHLNPIRGELSIMAAILTIGHVVNYLASYLGQFFSGFAGMSATMVVSFSVSFLLIVLLAALGVTSIQAVRKSMSADAWKRIQKLSYPFFALVFVHLLLILGPSASGIEQKAFVSIIVYTGIFGAYAVLRVRKAIVDNRQNASGETVVAPGA